MYRTTYFYSCLNNKHRLKSVRQVYTPKMVSLKAIDMYIRMFMVKTSSKNVFGQTLIYSGCTS